MFLPLEKILIHTRSKSSASNSRNNPSVGGQVSNTQNVTGTYSGRLSIRQQRGGSDPAYSVMNLEGAGRVQLVSHEGYISCDSTCMRHQE